MNCPKCGAVAGKNGTFKYKDDLFQKWRCKVCRHHFNAPKDAEEPISKHSPLETKGNIITENELREKHDMFFRIQAFVKKIPDGRFIDESSLLRELSLIGKPRYRDALSRPELKDFKGRVDGVYYYGSHNSIKKLKSEGVLQ
jgi:hypothetical protein